jgi:hypothetical protein
MIDRHRKNPVRWLNDLSAYRHIDLYILSYPPSFAERRLDACVRPTPPLVGTLLSIGCLRQCAQAYRNGTLLVLASPLQRKPPGEGTAGNNAIVHVLEKRHLRTEDMRKTLARMQERKPDTV